MVQDQQQGAPGKPFFLYFALGAMHAPHHVAPEWVDPYRGVFDKGWDAWREEVFARQVAIGRRARGHRAHRAAGVGAGLGRPLGRRAAHARAPAGGLRRLPHPHRRPDRPAARLARAARSRWTTRWSWSSPTTAPAPRAAASAASTSTASPRTCASRWPTTWPHYDDWGGFSTYNHYSWAWAWAGNTPHKLWKRYTWLGGTRTPLIVHWPGASRAPGAVRGRSSPTSSTSCRRSSPPRDSTLPDEVDGVAQQPVDGASLLAALDDPDAAELHTTQYFEMLGLALHLPRGLEGDDRPHQHGRARRGGAGRREPRLRRGPLGALRPLAATSPRRRPRRRRARARARS